MKGEALVYFGILWGPWRADCKKPVCTKVLGGRRKRLDLSLLRVALTSLLRWSSWCSYSIIDGSYFRGDGLRSLLAIRILMFLVAASIALEAVALGTSLIPPPLLLHYCAQGTYNSIGWLHDPEANDEQPSGGWRFIHRELLFSS